MFCSDWLKSIASRGERNQPDLKAFGISCHLIEPGVNRTPILNQMYDRIAAFEVPDDLAKEYPKEFIEKHISYVRDVTEAFIAPNCDAVVDAYEHALFGMYPRARYSLLLVAKVLMRLPEYALDYAFIHREGGRKPQPRLIY
ncbi:hypothetical protein CAPTEDRAFT_200417 [Capitella teleta]|uniref:Uncharacterized protein n=1 Tax=Capitella teleta TaxID=283909 RepID=R7UCT2_CAPTE|nr:hypothetical protein CAPTEDRAFT_200417 [Capitella teleta]|eukprot:ELU01598.1 hypothetical protein CAPTEDRAFT_200417 [Capitella teleta]